MDQLAMVSDTPTYLRDMLSTNLSVAVVGSAGVRALVCQAVFLCAARPAQRRQRQEEQRAPPSRFTLARDSIQATLKCAHKQAECVARSRALFAQCEDMCLAEGSNCVVRTSWMSTLAWKGVRTR